MQTLNALKWKIALATASITIGALISFVFWEFLLRQQQNIVEAWHDPATQFDAELGWAPIASYRALVPWGWITTNEQGYRSAPIDKRRRPILILGDSVAWGIGLDDQYVVSSYLEQKVRNNGMQVHNLAVSGYGLGQSYLWLTRNLTHFQTLTEVYLVLCLGNDFDDTVSNARYGLRKPLFTMQSGALKLNNVPISKYNMRNVLTKSEVLWRLFPANHSVRRTLDRWVGERRLSRANGALVVEQLLIAIKTLIHENNGNFTIILSPKRQELLTESDDSKWFKNLVERLKIGIIDFRQELIKDSPNPSRLYYFDDHHLLPRGHRLLAETIYSDLNP